MMNLSRCIRMMAALLALGLPLGAQRATSGPRDSSAGRAVAAVLQGVVISRSDSTPLRGVDVWLVSIDRHQATDSLGRFRFVDLAPGPLVFEVRRIGFVVRRDTVTLESGAEVTRLYALLPTAQVLDTVRTFAGQQRYLSPALRGFEERRLSGEGGYFVSDSVLRRNEGSTLTNIISSHMPGLMQIHGVLVSSRKQCRGPALQGCSSPNCYVSIFVDNVLLYQARMAADHVPPPDLAKEFDVTEFAGAEFYPGGASAPVSMHANDDGCGTLWLWTRER